MRLARVRGTVVSSVKSSALSRHKLLLVADVDAADMGDGSGVGPTYVAVDLAGAGHDEVVIVTHGSAARVDVGGIDVPTDAAVIGIVDFVAIGGHQTYAKS